jgi:altronate dehydratase large subunit
MSGFLRPDGRKGIRNRVLIAYTVDCARHVAEEIAEPFRDRGVRVIGFPNCYPSPYGQRMLLSLATHPNVGAALLVSLGCESFRKQPLAQAVAASGRPTELLTIQKAGGTRATIAAGGAWVENALAQIEGAARAPVPLPDVLVGVLPGEGSAATCRILGGMIDRLIASGASIVIDDLSKDRHLASYAADRSVAAQLAAMAGRAQLSREAIGDAGLEIGSGGVWAGAARIAGLVRPAERPTAPGLHLLDNVPDGPPRYGSFDVDPYLEMAELASCGAQLILAGCGRSALPVDSSVAPVLRVCAEAVTDTDDIDVVDDGADILDCIAATLGGAATAAERQGDYAFTLIHKHFEPAPAPAEG